MEITRGVQIPIMENILDKNSELSEMLKRKFTNRNILCVNLLGAPGVGKTTFLTNLIPLLGEKCFVIEGDIQSDIDTQKLNSQGIKTVQINTFGACHLEPQQIESALDLPENTGYVFIENIGNLVCPAEFLIGEHIKLLLSTTTEGSDKPYKYPLAFEKADIIAVNKCDLLPYVEFNYEYFSLGVRKLNQNAPIVKITATQNKGIEEIANWLKEQKNLLSRA